MKNQKVFWDSKDGNMKDSYKEKYESLFKVDDERFAPLYNLGYTIKKKFGQVFIIKDNHTLAILRCQLGG